MRRKLVLAVLTFAACGGRSLPTLDGMAHERALPPAPELGAGPDRALPTGPCKPDGSNCRDLVVSRLILPVTDPQKYALQIDGKSYNAAGAILGALAAVTLDSQGSVDAAVNSGTALLLLRLQADSFTNAPLAAGKAWLAAPTSCCTNPASAAACAAEAKATCFKGDHVFAVDPASQPATLGGKIAGGQIAMSGGRFVIRLPLLGAGALELALSTVQLRGRFAGLGIEEGVLAGALAKTEVDGKLIPAMAALLDSNLKSPQTPPSLKQQIQNLFDQNKDGTISAKEVAGNPLITTFLSGDVDADGDGSLDLSLGVGFTAVPAVIKP